MPQVKAEKILTQEERARRMGYGRGSAAVGQSLDVALDNYYERRHARLQDDPERLNESRAERLQLQQFAQKHNLAPSAVNEALSILRDHEQGKASGKLVEVPIEQRREQLRLAAGDSAAAHELATRFVATVATPLAQEVPTLAKRFNESGAGTNPRLFLAFAQHAPAPEPEPPKAA